MDCIEAHRLIDQGIIPGSQSPVQAQLGFHLAACPQCRHYYQSRTLLLQQLLERVPVSDPATPHPSQPQVSQSTQGAQPAQRQHRIPKPFTLRSVALLLALFLPFLGLFWLISMLLDTQQPATALHNDASASALPTPNIQPAQSAQPAMPAAAQVAPPLPTPLPAAPTPAPLPAAPTPAPPAMPTYTPARGEAQSTPFVSAVPAAEREPADQQLAPSPWPTIQVLPSPVIEAPSAPAPAVSTTASSRAVAASDGAVTMLLLGHDLRPGEQDIPRTDAIMLVRIDPETPRIALLSLPRDLWVTIPGYGSNRINLAYQSGELHQPGSGLAVARSTVSTLLDIPIDYVALIGFEGFIELVDSLDGITINVEQELYDAEFPTMDYGYTVAHFLPGPQHMDGVTALTYSRTRHPDSDFMRILRQQKTLISIGRRLRERGNLQTIQHIEQTTHNIIDLVSTDMPNEQIISLMWTMRDFDTSNVERYALGAEGVTFGVGDDRYALVPSRPALDSLTRQFLGGSP